MRPVERFFYELGSDIRDSCRGEPQWRARFHSIAAVWLAEYLPDAPSGQEILAELACAAELPPQGRIDEGFGQPSLTLFASQAFRIDALFWESASIAIHEHGFAGAFGVLEGGSLTSRYRFVVAARPEAHFHVGSLTCLGSEVLSARDVREIPAGRRLVHSVFHLGRPSVTIVVKTNGRGRGEFTFHPPHVGFDPSHLSSALRKKLQALELYVRLGRADAYCELAGVALASEGLAGCYQILLKTRQQVADRDVVANVWRAAEARGLPHWPELQASVDLEVRRAQLLQLKQGDLTRQERLLLGLLATLGDRRALARAVERELGDLGAFESFLLENLPRLIGSRSPSLPQTTIGRALVKCLAAGSGRDVFLRDLGESGGDASDVAQLSGLYDNLVTRGPFAALTR